MNGKKYIILIVIVVAIVLLYLYSSPKKETTLSTHSKDTLEEKYGTLKYAALTFRHGDRVPERFYPTDPHTNSSWSHDPGQLTNRGRKRAYNLGRYFKPRYAKLAGEAYYPTKVKLDASSYDRTQMSGQLFLAGFFPPIQKEVWNDELPWQPIPVHTIPAEYDNVLRQTKSCPRLDQLKKKFYQTNPLMLKMCTEYAHMISYIEKHSGLSLTPCAEPNVMVNLILLQDTLIVEVEQNFTLPEWTRNVFPEPLSTLRSLLFWLEVDDPVIRRFVAGPLLSTIASDMLNIAGRQNTLPKSISTLGPSETRPLRLFAGHDFTVITLLRALNMYPNEAPFYSAAVGFELRLRDNEYYVTVIYEFSQDEPPQKLDIPDCRGSCKLEDFVSLVSALALQDWDADCQINGRSAPQPFLSAATTPVPSLKSWTLS